MKCSICIIEYETGKTVKEIDVTGKTDRQVEKVDDGLQINLNHERFYTRLEKVPNDNT